MPTIILFLDDPYCWECTATVLQVEDDVVVLDRTVFYPGVGASSPDIGSLILETGEELVLAGAIWLGQSRDRLGHLVESGSRSPRVGEVVRVRVDGRQRLLQMRTHTLLHLVSVSFPFAVIGGAVDAGEGYIDFKADRTAMSVSFLMNQIQRLVEAHESVVPVWIDRSERFVDENSSAFSWPNRSTHLRAIRIGNFNIQQCDGLHVRDTAEIGHATVRGIFGIGTERQRIGVSVLEKSEFPYFAFDGATCFRNL